MSSDTQEGAFGGNFYHYYRSLPTCQNTEGWEDRSL